MKQDEINPYINADGSSKKGHEIDAMNWARKNELERRKSLPKAEQEKLKKADEIFAKRMIDEE